MQAGRIVTEGDTEVWAKKMEDGSYAVGLFNRGRWQADVRIQWAELGIKKGAHAVRDLWRQKDLGTFEGGFSTGLAPIVGPRPVLVLEWLSCCSSVFLD